MTGAPSAVCTVSHASPSADRCSSSAVAVFAGLSMSSATVLASVLDPVTDAGAAGVLCVAAVAAVYAPSPAALYGRRR